MRYLSWTSIDEVQQRTGLSEGALEKRAENGEFRVHRNDAGRITFALERDVAEWEARPEREALIKARGTLRLRDLLKTEPSGAFPRA